MISISKRLNTIAHMIKQGYKVADIGSDHAFLPTYLVLSGISTYVVAGEVNEGPYQSALRQVQARNMEKQIHVRKGNGLAVLNSNAEVDTIVIAGMGGGLIVQILTEGIDKLKGVKQLILQPNVGAELVRKFAIDHGWELMTETILEEDEHIYEILSFERGDAYKPYRNQAYSLDLLIKLGPFLIQQKEASFFKKWERELDQYARIMEQLKESDQDTAMIKRAQIEIKYKQIKEIIN